MKRYSSREKTERPTCPFVKDNGRCLVNCVMLIGDPLNINEKKGCMMRDGMESFVNFAESLQGASEKAKRGPGRPKKEE